MKGDVLFILCQILKFMIGKEINQLLVDLTAFDQNLETLEETYSPENVRLLFDILQESTNPK